MRRLVVVTALAAAVVAATVQPASGSKFLKIGIYDEVFRSFFLNAGDPVREVLTLRAHAGTETQAVLEVPATDPAAEGNEEQAVLGLMASDVDTLRHKSFAACTPEELAALRRIMARIRLTPPRRRSRRTVAGNAGRVPDLRRTVRELGGLGLATTDLVNARALLQGSPRTRELIATAPDLHAS